MININSRKRLGLSILYATFFIVLALMILPETYADIYNTSKPIIEVIYGEIPVTIMDYNLSDIYGINWTVYPITIPLYGLRGYNFTAPFLDNGDYIFYVLANDTDGNIVEGYREFTISHPEMAVWLIEPITGIGQTPTYNITVGTQWIATCRWSTTNWPLNNKEKFDLELGEPFNITGNMVRHTLTYTASPYPIPLYVFCRNDIYGVNLSDLANYGSTHFMVGYDIEPPEITELVADPNPVIDMNDKRTTISVVTNEPTVCHITGGNETHIGHSNWGWEDNYFAGEDPFDYTSYTLTHEENISYNSVPLGQYYNTRYNITCFDRAQWNDLVYQNVIVNISTSLMITQVTPASVGDLTIDYEVRTNVNANGCMMKLNGEPNWQNMVANTPRNFTLPITLNLGENDIEVFCYASTTAFANFTVTADNENPELQIDAFDSTCGLDEINVFVNATDQGTGINAVWYRVTDSSQQVIVAWTEMEDPTDTTLTIDNLELENGEQYIVTVYAIDNANLYSDNETDTLIATGPDEPECDVIAPIASISYVGDTYQKNVTIECTDDAGGTGCSESFEYAGITEGSCADVESYESMLYTEIPLILTSDTFLCVRVSDNALPPNYGYANMSIPVQTVICGNNIAEPGVLGSEPEQCDGIDLRGFTCNNFPGFNGGILSCTPPDGSSNECKWDTSNCQLGNHGYCGDNVTNDYHHEQCDGTLEDGDWGNIEDCTDFNFTGGTLSCNPYTMPEGQRCMFNTSGCYNTPNNPTPRCDGFAGSFLTLLDSNEQCEPFLFETLGIPALSCSDFDRFGEGELGCTDSCLIDITDCLPPPPDPFCGDGEIQPEGNETCDPPGSEILCSELDDGAYTGGTAVCGENCRWSSFPCTPVPYCGDNERTGDEQCDGIDLGNMGCADIGSFVGGILSCFPPGHPNECKLDVTNCDIGFGYCGDGMINNPFAEQCDGDSWGGISKQANIGCQQFGFSGGTLRCYEPGEENQCMFDTHLCIDVSPQDICGDMILQSGEQCETDKPFTLACTDFDSYTGGELECDYSTCLFDTTGCNNDPLCGNGQVDLGETCDGVDFGDLNDCSDLRPTLTGPLECFPPGHQQECQINEDACEYLGEEGYCGDGILNNPFNEQCDMGTNGLQCTDFNGFTGGILTCGRDCQFNTSQCISPYNEGYCGDGELNINEQCEPGQQITTTCQAMGFLGGTLSCNAAGTEEGCKLNIDNCIPAINLGYCGDGYVIPNQEWCDSSNLGGLDCTYFDGFVGGLLGCYPEGTSSQCYWDTSNCDIGRGYCGDGTINNPFNEQCDGDDWGRISKQENVGCQQFGFNGGTLRCYEPGEENQCMFDTSQCTTPTGYGPCGDYLLNKGEQCEKDIPFTLSCTDFDGYIGGEIGCDYTTCQYVLNECKLPSVGVCGDGFISGNELCDGLNLGPTTLCEDLDDEFIGGSLSCYPVGDKNECLFDLSNCEFEAPVTDCGNNNVEDGEECDGTENFFSCEDFGLESGSIGCYDDCTLDTSSCVGGTVIEQICGNDRSEPSEECDGEIEESFAQSFIDLYGCQYGLGCSDTCTIECLAEVTYTCDNLIKDGDETGFNCGGSCPPCDVGESCVDNTDCQSGRCVNGECAFDQCMNGLLDGDETGTDCGGSCPACPEGEYCFSDNDCQSGRCIDGICMPPESGQEEKKPNTTGIILIILGLVMMLGGGGYVIYEEYFDKKRIAAKHPPVMSMQQQRPQQPQIKIDPKLLEMQKKKQEERRQQQQDARRSLLEGFDKESVPKSEDDIEKLKERKVNKDVLKEAGYIDLTEQKTEEKESGDIFDKLKRIGDKQKSEERKAEGGFETYDDKGTGETIKSEEPVALPSRRKKSRLVKVKRKSDTFEKLGNIGLGVNKWDIRSTSGKISELSGKNKSSITKILNSESISQKQVNNMFSNLDKEKLTSDVFREILSDLVNNGKLSKETVSAMLFEYLDNGTLDKSDVAKIMSELKMV